MKPKPLVAEFVGTFALCWVGIYAIFHFGNVPGGLLAIALAHGITIAVMVSATMNVSGGHLNPAVTIAMLVAKRIKFMDALTYIICQIGAGVFAAWVMRFSPFFKGSSERLYSADYVTSGTPALTELISPAAASTSSAAMSGMILEAIATFLFVFVIFGSAVDKRAHKMGGLFIGLAITMGILAIGPMTGAAINPARWLGPAVMGDISASPIGDNFLVYFCGPIAGAIVAALVCMFVFSEKSPTAEAATE